MPTRHFDGSTMALSVLPCTWLRDHRVFHRWLVFVEGHAMHISAEAVMDDFGTLIVVTSWT